MFLHCIIRQQTLCAKYMDVGTVMDSVEKLVFLRSQKLNHRQLRDMLKDADTELQDSQQ
jgi:hypothetical protein